MVETPLVATTSAAFTWAMALPTSMRRCSPVAVVTTGFSVTATPFIARSSVAVWPLLTVTVPVCSA